MTAIDAFGKHPCPVEEGFADVMGSGIGKLDDGGVGEWSETFTERMIRTVDTVLLRERTEPEETEFYLPRGQELLETLRSDPEDMYGTRSYR